MRSTRLALLLLIGGVAAAQDPQPAPVDSATLAIVARARRT